MRLIYFFLAIVFGFSSASFAAPEFTQVDYEEWTNAFRRGRSAIKNLKIEDLSKYHVVFIGGYFNELAPGYFAKTSESVIKLGASGYTILMPSSSRTVEENSKLLHEELLRIHQEADGKPILAIGHSKGGVELMATVLAHPELLTRGILKSIVTVQSPLTGCYLATCSSEMMKWTKSLPMLSGGHSLSDQELKRMILDPLKRIPKAIRKDISRQVHYVISQQQAELTALAITLGNRLIAAGTDAKNDGLVEEQKMFIKKFGEVLGTLKADHMELVIAMTLRGLLMGLNTSLDSKNQAFAYLLMKSLLARISILEATNKSCQTVFY